MLNVSLYLQFARLDSGANHAQAIESVWGPGQLSVGHKHEWGRVSERSAGDVGRLRFVSCATVIIRMKGEAGPYGAE